MTRLSTMLAACAVATPVALAATDHKLRTLVPGATRGPSGLKTSANVVELKPVKGVRSSARLTALRQAVGGVEKGVTPVFSADYDVDYVTEVSWGGKTFTSIIDTGSSDHWLPLANFTCVDYTTYEVAPQSSCGFGALFTPDESFSRIDGVRFDATYGDGTFARGFLGWETVGFAGIAVENQVVGVANVSGWFGDGTDSGVLGLAFPYLTNAYAIGASTTDANRLPYNPILTNMVNSGVIDPVFSMAIRRNSTGSLAVGGVVPQPTEGDFSSAPFEYSLVTGIRNNTYTFYTTNVTINWQPGSVSGNAAMERGSGQSSHLNNSSFSGASGKEAAGSSPEFPAVIDSGTTALYLPIGAAAGINNAFQPPATSTGLGSVFLVDCGAIPPQVSVTIGNGTFYIDPRDLVIYNGDGTCSSSVYPAYQPPAILGDALLRNVVAVFDIGASELRFAQAANTE